MKQVRKIYDRVFKEKAVQLSYDRYNYSSSQEDLSLKRAS
jgi:transposase